MDSTRKVVVELSRVDRELLRRIVDAVEGNKPDTRQQRLMESALASVDDSVLFPTVGPDGVVRHG